jgi:hypothetical protein
MPYFNSAATGLNSSGIVIDVVSAAPPTGSGQVLTTTDGTHATWQSFAAVDQAVLQTRRTTDFALTTDYQDVQFDVNDIMNDITVLSHSIDTNSERINVGNTGKYLLAYSFTAPSASSTTTYAHVLKNSGSIVSSSQKFETTEADSLEQNVISHTFLADLALGDYITLQLKASTGTPVVSAGATFSAIRLAAAGSATSDANAIHVSTANEISLITEKTVIANADVVVIEDTAAGNAKKRVQAINFAPFGRDYQSAHEVARTTTTASTMQTKVSLTTTAVTGEYRVNWQCVLDASLANKDVEAQLYNSTDAAVAGTSRRFRVSATTSKIIATGFFDIDMLGVAKTLQLQYRSPDGSTTVGCQDAWIEFWREGA